MKHSRLFVILVITFIITSSCGSTGAFNTATLTEVQLSDNNYKIVATNVQGEASAGYILGLSTAVNSRQMQTFAIARVAGSGMIYGEALKNLWNNFREQYGKIEGRKLALINVRYDTEALNLLLYTKPTVSVRADVVEFVDEETLSLNE